MRIKLDENLSRIGVARLMATGHDVETVVDEGLSGASDQRLIDACASERRALVTLDHDFGNIIRFPPQSYCGIVVLELRGRISTDEIEAILGELAEHLKARSLGRELWIVERGRLRIHLSEQSEGD